VAAPQAESGIEMVGAIEVTRKAGLPEVRWAESSFNPWVAIFVMMCACGIAIFALTRIVITRPIQKLLAGMDEVTRGDLSHTLLADREDEVGQLASHFNDMTQSLRESKAEGLTLEQQLQKAEKMATIGQLAAEIAHEVGTPLNVIAGRARALGRKSQDPQVTKNADIIFEQTSRITRIIQRLLDFSRRKAIETQPETVDLNRMCAKTLEFLDGRLAAARVTPVVHESAGLPPVIGYPDQLQQVLINLVINAVEAMPQGGQLNIVTRHEKRRRPGLENAPEQNSVVVEVKDTGPGIPAGDRERVFEPFYTTKESMGGTGLGLAVSSSIIKEHDGWIEIDDGPGSGAILRVCIPTSQS
jgi:signal transduction histidine kinase